ncbi:MAG: hypothetical protein CMC96_03145 [Flavobacteriales bacterium]|nr:hypothetical protein [Flavobacteriales bacterium]|tara:strand:- start:12150 stop:12992 length:843 start_codon:yes stop_codon:yes gene_type:complete
MRNFSALLFTLFLSGSSLLAQHSTLRFSDSPINLNNQSLLIVPFESRMFLCEINRELATENQLSVKEITDRFTSALDQSILYTFQERCDVSSFYLLEDEEAKSDLSFIYSNIKLEYELVEAAREKNGISKLKSKIKKEDNSYQRGRIENGQVVTKRDDRERYMKAVVKDPQMLDSMHYKFNNKYFLFVNELDIKNIYEGAHQMAQMDFEREIKLHYTLYQKNGEILSTGVSKTHFPAKLNDINLIIKNYFPILAQQIYADLFPSEGNEAGDSKFNLKKWK